MLLSPDFDQIDRCDMDPLLLIVVRNAIKCTNQREAFDRLMQPLNHNNPNGYIRKSLDILKGTNQSIVHPYDFIYSSAFVATENDDDFPIIAAMAAAVLSRKCSGDFVVRQRLNWNLHVKTLIREGLFKKMYRMSPSAFNKLLKMLLPWMNVDNKQSSNASKGRRPIVAEIILHCTLRYLAGGSVHDIRVCAGLSQSSFYRAVHRGLDAINDCPSLSINFPMTLSDLSRSAAEFKSISSHGVIDGCIAALDGWLCRIRVPSAKEVRKVTAYFSGHYQCYGLNVQATCDASCRFTSLSVLCPGGTSDSKSFYASRVYNLVQELPDGYFAVGDNAYTLSSTLLIPYSGKDKQNASKDAFNFFLSQLRIRIEQAFGLLVSKWRIFKKPLEVQFWRTTLIIEATFRLHNFCINMGESTIISDANCDPESFCPSYMEYLDALGILDNVKSKRHAVRQAILEKVKSDGRRRPRYNIVRNSIYRTPNNNLHPDLAL